MPHCASEDPPLQEVAPRHQVACWLGEEAAMALWQQRQAAAVVATEAAP
jgi:hypothetical protein